MPKSISEQLQLFGLNPNDWKIQKRPLRDGRYAIVNRQDRSFRLKGKFQDKIWTQLEWAL